MLFIFSMSKDYIVLQVNLWNQEWLRYDVFFSFLLFFLLKFGNMYSFSTQTGLSFSFLISRKLSFVSRSLQSSSLYQAGDTCIPLPRKFFVDTTKNCRLQSWTLYKSADCRWISITILYVSFTNSATLGRLKQVQLCNRLINQSADNITGLKCAKECVILKYKYIKNPWLYCLHG